jgi:hypothetical protein
MAGKIKKIRMINALPTDFINMPRLNLFGSQSLMTFGMHVDIDLVIKAENPPVFKPGMRGHLHEYK